MENGHADLSKASVRTAYLCALFPLVIYCILYRISTNNDIIINLLLKPKNSLRTKFAFSGII